MGTGREVMTWLMSHSWEMEKETVLKACVLFHSSVQPPVPAPSIYFVLMYFPWSICVASPPDLGSPREQSLLYSPLLPSQCRVQRGCSLSV